MPGRKPVATVHGSSYARRMAELSTPTGREEELRAVPRADGAAPRALVLGATGYIGGRLVPRLVAAGYRVRVLVRDPARLAAFDEAEERFLEFQEAWGAKYPAIVRLWSNSWAEFVPFLQFDREIRRIVCTTNAIESVNARIRKAVKARGHFPNEQAALKCVYLAVMALDPTGKGRARWTQRWKQALNAFDIAFDGRQTSRRP